MFPRYKRTQSAGRTERAQATKICSFNKASLQGHEKDELKRKDMMQGIQNARKQHQLISIHQIYVDIPHAKDPAATTRCLHPISKKVADHRKKKDPSADARRAKMGVASTDPHTSYLLISILPPSLQSGHVFALHRQPSCICTSLARLR